MAVEGKGRLGRFKLPLNPRTPIHTSLMKLGSGGEERKGGGGKRAPSPLYHLALTLALQGQEAPASFAFERGVGEQDIRAEGEGMSAPTPKLCDGNGWTTGKSSARE